MSIRVTQQTSAALAADPNPEVRVSGVDARAATTAHGPLRLKFTQVFASFIGEPQAGSLEPGPLPPPGSGHPTTGDNFFATQVYAQVLITRTPNFEWIEMFVPEVFPHDISFNSIGATRFQTDVALVDSGHDQRNQRWDQPLMEYDVAYGVRTMEQLHDLIAFFRAMRGRLHAFLYDDYVDNTSTLAQKTEARRAPDPSPYDQEIGVGDEVTKVFQLVKHYPTLGGMQVQTRPIYKPKPGSVMIAVDGQIVGNWTVDDMTGKVTFTPPLLVTGLSPMQIARHPDDAGQQTPRWIITGPTGWNEGFAAFVNHKIVMSGWVNFQNNTTEADTVRLLGVSGDTITVRSTSTTFGAAENNVNAISIYVHPAPRPGLQITAGYRFYVPVRFDTDRLPVSIEEYGVGGAADVKLIEVRPHEE